MAPPRGSGSNSLDNDGRTSTLRPYIIGRLASLNAHDRKLLRLLEDLAH